MNKQVLALLIPILALCIPVAAIVLNGLQKLARLRLEEARVRAGAVDQGSQAELAALRGGRRRIARRAERGAGTARLHRAAAESIPRAGAAPGSPDAIAIRGSRLSDRSSAY